MLNDADYRIPPDLSRGLSVPKRVAVIGSCMTAGLPEFVEWQYPDCKIDFLLWGPGAKIPARPPQDPSEYEFLIIQLPIRPLFNDSAYFRLKFNDVASYKSFFDQTLDRISFYIHEMSQWTRDFGIPTFFMNFLIPQQNPHGRLTPRADLRNKVYFV